jgi:SNF2 family DNA or RNA helicase
MGACLADDMGLGKTIQTLALLERDRGEDLAPGPVLLVCPTSVLGNWQREAERFTPGLAVLLHHGPGRARGSHFESDARRHDLVLTSYGLLHRDRDALGAVTWGGVILDEAQNIKNPETHQARAARSLPAAYRAALTGTPVENHVGDLWSLMEFLNPGLLGSRAAFRRNFLVPIQAHGDLRAAEALRRVTRPFVLRRVKTDPAIAPDLPEKVETLESCTLTQEQATLYRAVLRDVEEALAEGADGIRRKGLVLATLLRLKQVCNHPAQYLGDGSRIGGRSGKLARMVELLAEVLEEGQRSLVFTQFVEMGRILVRHLGETFGREVLFLHGGVPRKERDRMVARFQDEEAGEAPPLFVLSLKAGGTGLNLTGATHVFHYDRWWNPAVENQATDRAFRIGQRRNVHVHKLVCAGTLEERIDRMIEAKKETADAVVGTGEAWLTELDDRQLREVWALGASAVEEAGG